MAKLGKTGRPPAIIAIKAHCRECVDWNQIDYEIKWCPLYYWMPYRGDDVDLSWVEANAYSSRVEHDAWKKERK